MNIRLVVVRTYRDVGRADAVFYSGAHLTGSLDIR